MRSTIIKLGNNKKRKGRNGLQMQSLEKLTPHEREIWFSSLDILNKNSEFFVIRFYYYLVKTKAGSLFRQTEMEKQYSIFNASLNLILDHITNPMFLKDHMPKLVGRHDKYGNMAEYVDDFKQSFLNALQEVFIKDSEKEILFIWEILLLEILSYFKV